MKRSKSLGSYVRNGLVSVLGSAIMATGAYGAEKSYTDILPSGSDKLVTEYTFVEPNAKQMDYPRGVVFSCADNDEWGSKVVPLNNVVNRVSSLELQLDENGGVMPDCKVYNMRVPSGVLVSSVDVTFGDELPNCEGDLEETIQVYNNELGVSNDGWQFVMPEDLLGVAGVKADISIYNPNNIDLKIGYEVISNDGSVTRGGVPVPSKEVVTVDDFKLDKSALVRLYSEGSMWGMDRFVVGGVYDIENQVGGLTVEGNRTPISFVEYQKPVEQPSTPYVPPQEPTTGNGSVGNGSNSGPVTETGDTFEGDDDGSSTGGSTGGGWNHWSQ